MGFLFYLLVSLRASIETFEKSGFEDFFPSSLARIGAFEIAALEGVELILLLGAPEPRPLGLDLGLDLIPRLVGDGLLLKLVSFLVLENSLFGVTFL